MTLRTEGTRIVDQWGRQRLIHGINLINKGPSSPQNVTDSSGFLGSWRDEDLDHLESLGLDTLRLGVLWAAAEPSPGTYGESYLEWIGLQLDRAHAHGLQVILDAHQDLYSQVYCDGAPAWATLSAHPFEATEYWSDAYLTSPAVQQSLDAFWANDLAPDGVGLQDHVAALWGVLAERFGGHPAVIGYDPWNEPAPGSPAGDLFMGLIGTFAQITGQDPERVAADFEQPDAKLAQLAHLDDVAVHRAIGDALAEPAARIEQVIHGLYERCRAQIRRHDPQGIVLREHNYFGNLGIPAAIPPLLDENWVYSPHGYDLLVDTDAMHLSSDRRVRTIFERAAENATSVGVPVLVGEWGAFDDRSGIARHCASQLDLFEELGWGWLYWVWTPQLRGSEAELELRRPRPRAIAGTDLRYGRAVGAEHDVAWAATWVGSHVDAPSELFIPSAQPVRLQTDGTDASERIVRTGDLVRVAAGPGTHLLLVG